MLPVKLMAPPLASKVRSPVPLMMLDTVLLPLSKSIVAAPFNTTALLRLVRLPLSKRVVDAPMAKLPLPAELFLSKAKVPALTTVPPV